jgi:hypothetical protein
MNVLEASDLGKRYGDTRALRECTLTLPPGHLAALVGPSPPQGPPPSWPARPPGRRPRWTASRSSRRRRRCTGTCPPGTCCIPAMAGTLGVYFGLAVLTWTVLRKHYPLSVVSSPVSRFWPMPFVEGGWLLVLSVLLVAATVWLVRRRAA